MKAELADGSIIDTPVYRDSIDWFGVGREIDVMASDASESLFGTVMLRCVTLFLDLDKNVILLELKER